MISAATYRLVEGFFACEDRGQPTLKGVTTPLTLYRVVKESEAQSRFDVAVQAGLTPLVGRDEELALLRRRWDQAQGVKAKSSCSVASLALASPGSYRNSSTMSCETALSGLNSAVPPITKTVRSIPSLNMHSRAPLRAQRYASSQGAETGADALTLPFPAG